MALYETSITLECSPEAAFEFLIRPENSLAVSPPGVEVTLVDAPAAIELGSRVTIQIRVPGISQKFVHEVVEFERPQKLVVQQVEGVFKQYRHEQRVEPRGAQVEIIDRVEFTPPGGLLGFVLTERRITEGMQAGFRHRHRQMKRRLERGRE